MTNVINSFNGRRAAQLQEETLRKTNKTIADKIAAARAKPK